MIKLINLETGEIIEADVYKLMEMGLPGGFRPVNEISQEEWAELYSVLVKLGRDSNV